MGVHVQGDSKRWGLAAALGRAEQGTWQRSMGLPEVAWRPGHGCPADKTPFVTGHLWASIPRVPGQLGSARRRHSGDGIPRGKGAREHLVRANCSTCLLEKRWALDSPQQLQPGGCHFLCSALVVALVTSKWRVQPCTYSPARPGLGPTAGLSLCPLSHSELSATQPVCD